MPVELSKGFKTSWYAFSSLPPHADQTVTSVDDAVWLLPPPDDQAISRKTPSPPAIARELSRAKTPAISAVLPKIRPQAGALVALLRVKTNVRLRQRLGY